MTKKKYHKNSESVCLICDECREKVCGISEAHAKENMKLHKAKSKLHKTIKGAIRNLSGSAILKIKEGVQE